MSNRSKNRKAFVPNYARRQRVEGELPPPPARPATVTELPTPRWARRQALRGAAGVGLLAGLGVLERHRGTQLRRKDQVVKQLHNPFTGRTVGVSKDMPVTRVQRLEARTADGRYATVSHANDATVLHLRMRQSPGAKLVRVTRRGGRAGARGSEIGKSMYRDSTERRRVMLYDNRLGWNPRGKTAQQYRSVKPMKESFKEQGRGFAAGAAIGAGTGAGAAHAARRFRGSRVSVGTGAALAAAVGATAGQTHAANKDRRDRLRAMEDRGYIGKAAAFRKPPSAVSRFKSGFSTARTEQAAVFHRIGAEQSMLGGGVPGLAGATLSIGTPGAGLGMAATYGAGHHRGKQAAKKSLVQMPARLEKRQDAFGKSSADRTVLADRRGANSNIPDGARRGRRIPGT